MAYIEIVKDRLKFSLWATGAGALLAGLASWWFHGQMEYAADNHRFLFCALVAGALVLAWVGLLISYLVAVFFIDPRRWTGDFSGSVPWWIIQLALLMLLIGGGWFMIQRYSDRSASVFDLLFANDLVALEDRITSDRSAVDRIDKESGMTPVQMAFRFDHSKAVGLLLANGASRDGLDEEGRNPVIISLNDPSMLGSLLEGGLNPDALSAEGAPPIHYAVEMSAFNAVVALSEAGVKIDAPDQTHRSALARAVENDNLPMVDLLLALGANANAVDKHGDSSLHKAVRRQNIGIAELLVKNAADQRIFNFAHFSPLHIAAAGGYDELVALLLLQQPDIVDLTDAVDRAPLDLALSERKFAVATALIEAGADINRTRTNGNTPLLAALLSRDYQAARFLIRSGAAVDLSNEAGETALDIMRRKQLDSLLEMIDHPEVGRQLVESAKALSLETENK